MKKLFSLLMAAFVFSSSIMYTDIHQNKRNASTLSYADGVVELASEDLGEEEDGGNIRVQIEDNYLNATPIVRNGRTMLPFRAVFEGLGGKVSFDKKTNKITANVSGKVIVMKVGDTMATLTENGNSKSVTLAAAPFVSKGQTYIPVRDVATMTGLKVEYSKFNSIVNIYDQAKLIADINKDFTIYNSLLKKGSTKNLNATYRSNIDLSANLEVFAMGQNRKASGKITFDGLTQAMNLNGTFKLKLEPGDFLPLISESMKPEELKLFNRLMTSDYRVIMDGNNGKLFVKSDLLSAFTDNPTNTWLSISDNSMVSEFNKMNKEYIEGMLQNPQNLTMGEILYHTASSQVKAMDGYGSTTYRQVQDAASVLKVMFGDDGFVKTGSGYELKLDKAGLAKRLAKYIGNQYIQDPLEDLTNFDYKLVLKNVDSDNIGIELKLSATMKDHKGQTASIDMNVDANNKDAKMTMDFKFPDMGKFHIDLITKTQETNEKIALAPPAGENVKALS